MATFNIVLDKRSKLKDNKYNLAIRMVNGNDVMYINLQKMTESQYEKVFNNKAKDEDTRKNNRKPIIVPLTDKLRDSIARVGDKKSPFLLGMLKEGYDESFFKNRNHKVKQQINRNLKDISDQLKLSQPLNLGSARDCYANTLRVNKVHTEDISQMLGHSNVIITEHYLAGLNPDFTFGINQSIL